MTKRAYVDISGEALADVLPVLDRAGLTVTGSAKSERPVCVRLIIEGDRLPDACAGPKLLGVGIMMACQHSGTFRQVEISAINVLPEPTGAMSANDLRRGRGMPGLPSAPEDAARLAGC